MYLVMLVSAFNKTMKMKGQEYSLQLVDTAGQVTTMINIMHSGT